MKTVHCQISVDNKAIFDALKDGRKSVETRAATGKFVTIEPGDELAFHCADEQLERKVVAVTKYADLKELLAAIPLSQIMPDADSVDEAIKIWHSFPGYEEKIKQFGILAFKL